MPSKPKPTRQQKADAWENILTGVGTARDKRRYASMAVRHVSEEQAEEIYRGSAPAARAVEVPPWIQLGNGFRAVVQTLEEDGDELEGMQVEQFDALPSDGPSEAQEAASELNNWLDELNAPAVFMEAACWERAYGGSAILLGADDGQRNLALPLREPTLRGIRYLVTLRPRECRPLTWNSNPLSPGYGLPVTYRVQRDTAGGTVGSGGFEVHASRLIRFPGRRVSRRHLGENHGWGDSVFTRWVEGLRDYEATFDAIPALIADFAQAVWKVKGLAALLAADEDELVIKRMKTADQVRSFLKVLITDAEDSFERQQTPVSGLPELADRMAKKWAADVGIPPGLLFGDAPSGLNANGDANLQFFYKEQRGAREMYIAPRVKRLVRLGFLSLEGPTDGVEPKSWSIDFGPLYEPTAAELADLRGKQATADKAYVDAGVLLPEEVAVSRFGQPGGWNPETVLDADARKVQAEADAELEAAQLEAAKNGPQPGAPGVPVPGQAKPKPPPPGGE